MYQTRKRVQGDIEMSLKSSKAPPSERGSSLSLRHHIAERGDSKGVFISLPSLSSLKKQEEKKNTNNYNQIIVQTTSLE